MFKKHEIGIIGILIAIVLLLGCAQPPQTPTPTPKPEEPIVICALFDPRIPVLKADVEAIRV
ncbi:MAG: hypothetical protein QXU61_06255, partial [Archaeoglobaceae archaeon]